MVVDDKKNKLSIKICNIKLWNIFLCKNRTQKIFKKIIALHSGNIFLVSGIFVFIK